MQSTKKSNIYRVTVIAMLCAISYVAVWLGRAIPDVQGFLSYDPKDAVVAIGGFIYGPVSALIISVIVSFIEMITISKTGPYGLIMNIVSTCSFAVTAALIYKKNRSMKGAVLSLACGMGAMCLTMVLWNYIITPLYMGVPRAQVAGMLATVFFPFNLVKSGINTGLTMLLYKPIVGALRSAKLLPAPEESKGRFHVGFTLVAIALLVTFILLLLVMLDIL